MIYRQFSITIVSAMTLSVIVAIILTPMLCATFLRPDSAAEKAKIFSQFNHLVENVTRRYAVGVNLMLHVLRSADTNFKSHGGWV